MTNIRPFLVNLFGNEDLFSAASKSSVWINSANQRIELKIDFDFKKVIEQIESFVFSINEVHTKWPILVGKFSL